jgi:hypothetical protein
LEEENNEISRTEDQLQQRVIKFNVTITAQGKTPCKVINTSEFLNSAFKEANVKSAFLIAGIYYKFLLKFIA